MKTLFIAPQVPWPLDVGSKIRIDQILRAYASISDVTIVAFAQNAEEAAAAPEFERRGHELHVVPFDPPPTRNQRLALLASVLNPTPRMVTSFSTARFAERVRALLQGEPFDVLHIERLSMMGNVIDAICSPAGRVPLRILDLDDVESVKMRRNASLDAWNSPGKYLRLLESVKLARYEHRALRHLDCALVCSDRDRTLVRARGASQIEVFANGADEPGDSVDPASTPAHDGRTLLYLGNMGYAPNEDAVLYFATSILPLVRREMPDVRFVVAGKNPSARVRALDNGRDITVTGYVEDKWAMFRRSTILVVPLKAGGGTRIKILEAMAVGCPVVSTSVGYEGIDAVPGKEVVVANTPVEFASACGELLRNPGRREALANAAHGLVRRKYAWDSIRRDFVQMVKTRLEHG